MSTAAEEFLIKLTERVSGPAGAAGGALSKLEAQIRKEEAALGKLESKLGSANAKLAEMMEGAGKGSVSIAAIEKQRAAIAALQDQIAKQRASVGALGGARDDASGLDAAKAKERAEKKATADRREAEKDAKKIDADKRKREGDQKKRLAEQKRALAEQKAAQTEAASAINGSLGPLGSFVSKLGAATTATGGAAIAVVALVAILTALAVAAIAAAVALTRYAASAADAARSARLFNQGAAGGAAKGAELTMIIDQIAGKVPLARAEIESFGRALALAGINGRRLQVALDMISAIESVVPGAGAKVQGLVERFQKLKRAVLTKVDLEGTGLALVDVAAQLAKGMGITQQAALAMLQNGTAGVDKVLDAMKKAVEQKFGKTLAAQMMGLQVQWQKLQENIAGLFAKVDLEAFLGGLKMVTDLFSQNTVMGRVLKEVLGAAFTGVFNTLAKLAPFAVAFFKGFAIGALQVYIAIKPLGQAIAALFGKSSGGDALKAALTAGTIAAHMLGVGIKFAMGMVIFAINVVRGLSAAFDAVSSAGGAVFSTIQTIVTGIAQLFVMAREAGGGLVDGIVQGIQAKVGAAIAAVASLGAAIEGALRNAIGWHSPATLGVDAAGAIGEGFQQEAGAQESKTSDAAGKMINPKDGKAGGGGGGKRVLVVKKLIVGDQEDLTALRAFFGNEIEFQSRA